MEDGYTVLDDIRNTPRYWKKAKHEMNAKLENLGSFQIFYTLSCADMRWVENWAAVLKDEGLHLTYNVIPDENGHHVTNNDVQWEKDGITLRKPVQEYLKEDGNESIHKLIRENVLLATRFFNDRVKKFHNLIIMGRNNPMKVQYYTYKVEFQERGAGHIHGTLWLDLEYIEDLTRSEDSRLLPKSSLSNEMLINQPFKGIKSTWVLQGFIM